MIIEKEFGYIKRINGLQSGESKVLFVFDENTERLFKKRAEELELPKAFYYVLPMGEEHKNLEEVSKLYLFLKTNDFDRNDVVIAVGGGVVTDTAGFTAQTYMRGCRFVSVPTTLLCMIDAAFGGKNGVNAFGFKNLIGGFYTPEAVIADVSFLKTLPEREYSSGLCELVKYDMITTDGFASLLLSNPCALGEVIEKAYKFKLSVTERDFTDFSERHILNFGHTVGHAVEELTLGEIPHGIAVAVGMKTEIEVSALFGKKVDGRRKQLDALFNGLNVRLPEVDILKASRLIKSDKKNQGEYILSVLVSDGNPAEVRKIKTDEYILAVKRTLKEKT